LHCCGVDGVHDWKWEGGKLPNSCCSSNKNCTVAATNAYKDGCGDKAYKWFKNGLDLLGILAVAIATIEVINSQADHMRRGSKSKVRVVASITERGQGWGAKFLI
jgi:hypothetical protein